jgi:hypothetical protein
MSMDWLSEKFEVLIFKVAQLIIPISPILIKMFQNTLVDLYYHPYCLGQEISLTY